jgi:Transglycosylase SLT domain
MRPIRKPRAHAAALAVAAIALCAATAQAQSLPPLPGPPPAQVPAPRLGAVRCVRHPCREVKPRGTIVLTGRGFAPGTLVVFSIRRGSYVINATRLAKFVSAGRLRAHVPSDAVSGPVYLLGSTARSNALWLNVRGAALCPSETGAGDQVTRWRPVVACVLGLLGQPQTQAYVDDVLTIIRGESGGDPLATNTWDSNAKAGDPSRGLMQVIGATFATYHDPALLDNVYDPAANIYAGLAYGIARYGSVPNIPGVKSVAAGGPYRPYKTAAR